MPPFTRPVLRARRVAQARSGHIALPPGASDWAELPTRLHRRPRCSDCRMWWTASFFADAGHSSRKPVLYGVLYPSELEDLKMAVQMTKSQLIEKIAAESELAKRDVKGVLETLANVGYKELKKSGVFLVPGLAKFVVVKKPATKARQGTNPFNGEPMMFKAKPARKIVRARPVKAAKDAV
jgi:DNA-binding protein HU-beta